MQMSSALRDVFRFRQQFMYQFSVCTCLSLCRKVMTSKARNSIPFSSWCTKAEKWALSPQNFLGKSIAKAHIQSNKWGKTDRNSGWHHVLLIKCFNTFQNEKMWAKKVGPHLVFVCTSAEELLAKGASSILLDVRHPSKPLHPPCPSCCWIKHLQ